MLGCLITITPLDSTRAVRTTVRLCCIDDRAVTGLGGQVWEPAVTLAPSIGMQFWNGDFEQGVDPGQIAFAFNLHQMAKRYSAIASFIWIGAAIEVRVGRVGDAYGDWPVRFSGKITDYAGDEYPKMGIRAAVDVEPFRADVLTRTYAGTGNAEGGPDLKGRLKPLALGRPRNVEPVLIDAVNGIYQFSGYGPIEGVETLFERASAFGPAVADYGSYAALVAANVRAGTWATCNAQGLVKLGAPAAGVITGDIRGHKIGSSAPVGAGALVTLAAGIAGLDMSKVAGDRFNALDASGSTASDMVLTDQVSILDLARRLVLPCNWQVFITNLGVLTPIQPTFAPQPTLTLDVQGRAVPLVKSAVEQSVSAPYYQTTMAAQRNWRVQSFDEIAFDAPLIDRGDYDPTVVYREGNIVSMSDGSRWLFISQTPRAGVTPGSDFTVWDTLTAGLTASDIRYADGTTLEQMQPADPGATYGAPNGSPVGNTTADAIVDRVGGAEQAISQVNDRATALLEKIGAIPEGSTVAEEIDRIEVADYGGNLLSNSDFAIGKLNGVVPGWALVSNAPASFFWGVDNADFVLPGEHYQGLLCLEPNGDRSGALISQWVAVQPDQVIQISAWIAARECLARIRLQWGDSAGNFLQEGAQSDVVGSPYTGAANLGSFNRVWAKQKVPTGIGATSVRLVLDKGPYLSNPAGNLSWAFMLRPMLALASADQTMPTNYRPVGGGAGLTAANAKIEENRLAAASDTNAVAQRTTTIEANFGSLAPGNLLPSSDFASGKAGWALYSSTPDKFLWAVDPDFVIPGEHYFGVLGLERNGDWNVDLASDWIAINGDTWLQASCWIASRECTASIALQWADGAGNYMGDGPRSDTIPNNSYRGSQNLDGFFRVWCKGKAPAGARFVRLQLHKGQFLANSRNDLSWLFALRPMVAMTQAEPTFPAAYAPRGGGAGLTAANAKLTETAQLAVANGQAVGQLQSILQVDTGSGQSARINDISQVAATAFDRVSGARWSKEAVAGNGRAQLTVYAFDNNGNIQSGVDIIGDLTIRGDLFVDGTVYTRKIAGGAVSSGTTARATSRGFAQSQQYSTMCQVTVTPYSAESVYIIIASVRGRAGDTINGGVQRALPFQVNVTNTSMTDVTTNVDSTNSYSAVTTVVDVVSGFTGQRTFEFQARVPFGNANAQAQVDVANLVVLELKR